MPTLVSVGPDRLTASRDVRRVLRHGTRRSGRRLTVHVLVEPGSADRARPRLAVVASARVGNAVVRNRAKRLMREAARQVTWPEGADIVLVARPGVVGGDLHGVLDELAGLVPEGTT